ncbi:MAG: hypothetical protein IJU60_02475 [Acholeplasmatales bacterium]|nr:hypothetical protein [Acholeplasmatales bacterium]
MEENKNELQPKPSDKRAATIFYVNLIILVAVIAFFVLGTVFRVASLHFRVVYNLGTDYNYSLFRISDAFLPLSIFSAVGYGTFNFVMIFVNNETLYKKRSAINVIIAISAITLLILVLNLL